ncbi:MAG: hypothetical protein R2814_11065 [Flavobacteriaceae bacterium]
MKTQTIKSFLLGIVAVLAVSNTTAQQGDTDNPFMDRDYWASHPSITDIDGKIAQGHSITKANRGGFDPTTFAILEETR